MSSELNPDMWRGLPGGPAIDQLVAEHVYDWRKVRRGAATTLSRNPSCGAFTLEWEKTRDGEVDNVGCVCHYTPRFSTDPAAAKEVTELLRRRGWLVVVKHMPDGFPFILGNDAVTDPKVRSTHFAEAQYVGHQLKPERELNDYQKRMRMSHPLSFAEGAELVVCCLALEVAHLERERGVSPC